MTPFLSVTGGGDQENTTTLFPATAVNPTGEPDGTEREIVRQTPFAGQLDNVAHILSV